MNENIKLLAKKLSEDEAMQAKLKAIRDPDEAYALVSSIQGGITKEEFAENLHMSAEELDEFLTPIRDYSISEIQNLLGALYLDIRVEVVPE